MAVGRVKDATLKVFANDYPTPYVSLTSWRVCMRVKPLPEMGRVLGIIFTYWTSRLVTCWH